MRSSFDKQAVVRELAILYTDDESVKRILDFASIPRELVRFSSRPIDTWYSAVTEAEVRGRIRSLLKVTLLEHPDNVTLHAELNNALEAGESARVLFVNLSTSDSVEKIMGTQSTLLPIAFLANGLAKARSVGRISTPAGALGTGFLIADELLVTNHHVLKSEAEAQGAEVSFDYELDAGGSLRNSVSVSLLPKDGFATSKDSDLTIIRVPSGTNGAWGQIEIEEFDIRATTRVNIVQHPGGAPKQIALYHNVVSHVDENVIQYYTDTLPGSSGSPLFDDQWRLVGIHHAGGNLYSPSKKRWVFCNEGIPYRKLLTLIDEVD